MKLQRIIAHIVVEVYGFKSFAKLLRLGYAFFKTERLTDQRRERLPNTLKAMQKRNLSAGKVEWTGFLNEVQSVSIRPSPIFFLFLFCYYFYYFFYTIEEAPHYHAPLVSGVLLKEAVSVKAVRCIRGRKEFALKLCPVNHLSS